MVFYNKMINMTGVLYEAGIAYPLRVIVFLVGYVLLFVLGFCALVYYFVCIRHVSYVPNVDCDGRLSILFYCPCGFSNFCFKFNFLPNFQ